MMRINGGTKGNDEVERETKRQVRKGGKYEVRKKIKKVVKTIRKQGGK